MRKQILFFHGGGGEDDYAADAKLVESLKANLGHEYSVAYPLLPDNGKPDLGRREQIPREIAGKSDGVILVAHSLGASMLLACLSEFEVRKRIAGIFLLATPFWSGNEYWVKPSNCTRISQNDWTQKYPCIFITVVMMKKSRLTTWESISNRALGILSRTSGRRSSI